MKSFSGEVEHLFSAFSATTLKECSYDDDKKEYLIDNESIEVLDFDTVSQVKHDEIDCQKSSSVDSIFFKDGKLYLLEFKNCVLKTGIRKDIKLKIHDSIQLLKQCYNLTVEDLSKTDIIIVARVKSPNISAKHVKKISQSYCPSYFKFLETCYGITIFKYDPSEFERLFLDKII